jgi:DNA-binding response OmpR family regulator
MTPSQTSPTTPSRPRLLLVEDDPGIRESLELGLGFEGFEVFAAASASEGLRLLAQEAIDVVILDILLPGSDGYRVLEEIRAPHNPKREVAVLFLTALDTVEDRVRGLRLGADDYLVKPFSLAELVARIEALWRRLQRPLSELCAADIRLYPDRREVWRGDAPLELSPKEFVLLQMLLEHRARVVSREALMQRLWGERVDPNTLEVHVSSLRRALGDPPLIRTVRGYGYLLDDPDLRPA